MSESSLFEELFAILCDGKIDIKNKSKHLTEEIERIAHISGLGKQFVWGQVSQELTKISPENRIKIEGVLTKIGEIISKEREERENEENKIRDKIKILKPETWVWINTKNGREKVKFQRLQKTHFDYLDKEGIPYNIHIGAFNGICENQEINSALDKTEIDIRHACRVLASKSHASIDLQLLKAEGRKYLKILLDELAKCVIRIHDAPVKGHVTPSGLNIGPYKSVSPWDEKGKKILANILKEIVQEKDRAIISSLDYPKHIKEELEKAIFGQK